MTDYFIKATNESEFWATLTSAAVVQNVFDPLTNQTELFVLNGNSLDVIGTIFEPTGNTLTMDGMSFPEMVAVPGFHANLRGSLSEQQLSSMASILIEAPSSPSRVWA